MIDLAVFVTGLHEQLFGHAKRHPALGTTLTESLLFAELLATLMETRRALERSATLAAASRDQGEHPCRLEGGVPLPQPG